MIPLGTVEDHLSRYVAACVHVVNKFDVRYEVHPMGTVIEGPLSQCLEIVRQAALECLKMSPRVIVHVRADTKPGFENRLHTKTSKIGVVMRHIPGETAEVI